VNPAIAAKSCLRNVLEVKEKENLIIIVDECLKDLGKIFEAGANNLGLNVNLIALDDSKIRTEAPEDFLRFLTETDVDIFINILRGMTEEMGGGRSTSMKLPSTGDGYHQTATVNSAWSLRI